MGGPMGLDQRSAFPHLSREIELLRACLANGTPVLGICRGAELLAVAAGGRVFAGPVRELGWHTLSTTEEARTDPLFRTVPNNFTALEWHSDYYDLPANATPLARSEQYEAHAFRIGTSAYGLLFHVEVTSGMGLDWIASFAEDVSSFTHSEKDQLLAQTAVEAKRLEEIARPIFIAFADIVRARAEG